MPRASRTAKVRRVVFPQISFPFNSADLTSPPCVIPSLTLLLCPLYIHLEVEGEQDENSESEGDSDISDTISDGDSEGNVIIDDEDNGGVSDT